MASPIKITITDDNVDERTSVKLIRFEGQLDEKEMLMKPIEPSSLLEKASKRLARVH